MNDAVEPTIRKIEGYIEGFFWILPNLGLALLVFLLFLGAAWAAKRAVAGVARRRDRGDLGDLLSGFVKWVVLVFGFLVVATIIFPSVKPADVLATLGIGSVAIGFAFKDILQNWLSGLLILYRQPFRRGDQIKSGEFEGTVEHIEARATLIKTYDGQRVVIPNADIYTRAVTVRTAFDTRRSEYVERDPAPEAIPWALDGSSVNIKMHWWSDPRRASVVHTQGRVIKAVKQALSAAGIDLPFPTRVVLLHDQTEESDGDRARQREGWPQGNNPPRPRHLNEIKVKGGGSGNGAQRTAEAPSADGDGHSARNRGAGEVDAP